MNDHCKSNLRAALLLLEQAKACCAGAAALIITSQNPAVRQGDDAFDHEIDEARCEANQARYTADRAIAILKTKAAGE